MDSTQVKQYLKEGSDARLSINVDQLFQIGEKMTECFKKGGKIILFGNGGSAADAQHIAAEFLGRFERERESLPALALHTNSSAMTAISNDYSYDMVYERQMSAFARKGDIVFGISTSGNSINILKGIEKAKQLGCITVSMSGKKGGKISEIADYKIQANSDRTPIIQEIHITIGHLLSKIVEDMI
ncbi:MAG: D-sedoheptulose-7-phosphate isomerase [Thermoplasmataceae archaeon]